MRYRFVTSLLAGIFFLGQALFQYALDPRKKITQYTHEVWGVKEGLPQTVTYGVLQGRDGYLWIATEEGLARYDGVRFVVFDKYNVEQILNNSIYALCETRDGNLWLGTSGGGLTCLNTGDGTFTSFTKKEGLSHDKVWSLCEGREGGLWIGTEDGLNHMIDGTFTVYTTKDGLSRNNMSDILEDRRGYLWIGTSAGLNRRDPRYGTFTVYTTRDGLAGDDVWSLYQDRAGNLWVGTYGGLTRRDAESGAFTVYTVKDGLSHNIISAIYEDRAGNLWVGTYYGGLNRLNPGGGGFTAYSGRKGLTDMSIWDISEDREGSLWIATEGGGLNRLRDGKFTTYGSPEGLPGDNVWNVFVDRAGALWIATEGKGLSRLKDGVLTTYTTKEGLAADTVWAVYEDRAGDLWVGTDGGGLNRLKDGKFITYTTKDGLSYQRVTAIYEDREGNLWAGTFGGGLNRLAPRNAGGKIVSYTTKDGLSDSTVTAIHEDAAGRLWIGTENGLNRRDPETGAFTVYTEREGLSYGHIACFYEEDDGTLWVGTYGGGLNRFKDGTFASITFKEGLFDDVVHVIIEDDPGNFWMSCNKGIFRVPKKELHDFCDGKTPFVHCLAYDDNDGMRSRECRGGVQSAGCKTRDGHLWFPTLEGVVTIDPNNIGINRPAPPLKIEAISVDGRKIQPTASQNNGKLVLPPGGQRVEIHYTAFSFLVPDRVRFKCKLEGFDREWRYMDTRRTAYYTKLLPGDYTFLVTACNDDGVWNEMGTYISFYLEPYFHQTPWFYLVIGAGVLFLGFGGYRLRVRQLTRRKMELEHLVAQRTRQLAETNAELEKLSIAVRETDNAVGILDAHGNFEWVNEGAVRMYGFTMEQMYEERGRNIAVISSHPGIRELLDKFRAEPKSLRYESLYRTRDGRDIWIQTTWTPVLDEKGNLEKIVSIGSDISKVKQSEDRIREQNEQILKQSRKLKKAIEIARKGRRAADEANRAKSEFLARMSHELRTPMNGIVGFTELLLDSPLNEEQLDYARTIGRSGEALTVLLNDILDFSKVEAGELVMTSVDFDPRAALSDACDIMLPRLEPKPVELLRRVDDNVPRYVKGDAGRFRQVLVNLLGNAVKFTAGGEIEISLRVDRKEKKRIKLHVAVRDTGIGVPAEKVETIFDVFHQVDGGDNRRYEGTGLGLAVSRQIAKLMKGNVRAQSRPGEGSTFHFTAWMDKSRKKTVDEENGT